MSANLRTLRASALALALVASGIATSAYAESSLGDNTMIGTQPNKSATPQSAAVPQQPQQPTLVGAVD